MIEKYWVDHLYKYIEIDDETLKFINHPSIMKKFFRLSKISQLGLASKIFPSAIHAKLEHNLGVYFLADYLVHKANLPSEAIKPLSFKIAAIIHGIGHFPFSIATETALQKASFLDKNVEEFITRRISPIVTRITRDSDPKEKKIITNQVFKERGKINHFYRFFTASLLCENEKELRQISKDSSGFNFDELLKYLISPKNVGFKLLHHIDRLDYILRDMFHLGFIKIDLNLSFYFTNLKVTNEEEIIFPSEWKVLDEFESYAIEKIYNEQRVKAAESLYQKIFTKAIFDSEIAFANLLEWGDKEIESGIKEYQEKKKHKYKILEQIDRIKGEFSFLSTYSFFESGKENTTKNLLLMEGRQKTIGNSLRKDIDKSIDTGIFKYSYFSSFNEVSDIYVNLVCLGREEIQYFLKEVAQYEKYYKKIDKNQIARCIWVNYLYKVDFNRYGPVVKILIEKMQRGRGFNIEQLVIKSISASSKQGHLPRGITSEEAQQMMITMFKIATQKVPVNVIDGFIDKLIEEPEEILLNKEFLSLIDFQDPREFLDFVRTLCNKTVRRIRHFRGRALEYYIYLNKVCEPEKRPDQIKKWVFPSTITDRGEIDVWSLYVFKYKKPLIELIECSITTDETKRLDATKKLRQKRAILEERFGKKIEITMFFNDEKISE